MRHFRLVLTKTIICNIWPITFTRTRGKFLSGDIDHEECIKKERIMLANFLCFMKEDFLKTYQHISLKAFTVHKKIVYSFL